MPEPLERKAVGGTVQTLLLRNKGTEYVKHTETASALLARDSKGFGNQESTAILELTE